MKKKRKFAETVSLQESTKTGYINAKGQDDLLAKKILARIGHRKMRNGNRVTMTANGGR